MPSFVMETDSKFFDFIKDDIDRISQIFEPSFVSKERSLLSWLIKMILFSNILILDLNGVAWFLTQTNSPSWKLTA